jgi:uncharacterized phage protein (TIGR02218 family)
MKQSFLTPINQAVPNLLINSEQYDLWAGAAQVVTNVDIAQDGISRTADQLTDSSATQFEAKAQSLAIPANTQAYCGSVYVRKTVGVSNSFGFNISLSGGTAKSTTPRMNPNTGVGQNFLGGAGDGTGGVIDAGAYWRLWAMIPNNGTNTGLTMSIQPAPAPTSGSVTGADAASTLGSAVLGGAQLERATTPSPYISTTGTSGIHTTTLVNYLRTHELPFIHDLYSITLGNGQVITMTDGALDIVSSALSKTFFAAKFGAWKRGSITSAASFDLTPSEMDLIFTDASVDAGGPVLLPGGASTLLQAIYAGLFDGATVSIWTAYMPTYGDLSLGLETKFVGDITALKALDRSHAEFTVSDLLYRLKQPWPPNVYQSQCPHSLFNANCALNASLFRTNASVAAGSTKSLIISATTLPGLGNDPLPNTQGVLTFASGANNGLSYTVRQQLSTTQLQLDVPTIMPVSPGDVFNVLPGCNKLMATCSGKFANLIHFGGMPYTPVPETII